MPIDRPDFDALSERDLTELVTSQVPEGLRLEFKREMYGNADADKRELLKDVSAFANAYGGHLIVGIDEQDGVATSVQGISGIPADDVVTRVEQLLRDGLDPRIPGIRIGAVPLANGAYCLVIRVPHSWTPPHRVIAQNSNRFWVRNAAGAHEASLEELRAMFTSVPMAHERVVRFRDARLAAILGGTTGLRHLVAGGRFILHIVPLSTSLGGGEIDLGRIQANRDAFQPIGSRAETARYNFEGYVLERGGEASHGYTQIFRDGSLEATKASIVNEWQGHHIIPGLTLEQNIFEALPRYIDGLRDVGVQSPLLVMISLEGVQGAIYAVQRLVYGFVPPAIGHDLLRLPTCLLEEYGTAADYQRMIKPALDALWNTAGLADAGTYAGDGTWTGEIRQR